MAKVEVTGFTYSTDYRGHRTPAFVCWYASDTFTTETGEIVEKGKVGTKDFCKRTIATLTDTTISVASFAAGNDNAIDATIVDGYDNGVTYTVVLTDSKYRVLATILKSVSVSDALSPTTIDILSQTTTAPRFHKPFYAYYTIPQQLALVANLQSAAVKADDAIFGILKTSVPPVSSANPIAVGDNDPRVASSSEANKGIVFLDVDPDDPDAPLAVGKNSYADDDHLGITFLDTKAPDQEVPTSVAVNSARVRKVLSADYVNSLSTAVTAIGATERDLVIKADTTVSANLTVPENLRVVVEDNALITVSSGTLTINNLANPGNRKIFNPTGAGVVRLMPLAAEKLNTVWWTGTNTAIDQSAGFQAALANISANNGGHLFVPAGEWLAKELVMPSNTIIEGSSKDVTVIKSPGGADPIFLHGEGVFSVSLRHLTLDGDGEGGAGYLVEGAYPNDRAGLIKFESVKFTGCEYGFRIHDTASTEWQVQNVQFDKDCYFENNTNGMRCNSSNNVVKCDAFFAVGDGQYGAYLEAAGQWQFSGEFAGVPAAGGAVQTESQTIVAAAGVTGNGVATWTVTAAGLTGSPVTGNVAVNTVDHTTAALIAAAFRDSLSAHPAIASFFYVLGESGSATFQIAALDPAANDATMNLAVNTGTATGITNSATSTNTTAGAVVANTPIGVHIEGLHGTITFDGTVDEGLSKFIEVTGGDSINSSLVFTGGCTLQGRCFIGAARTISVDGCQIAPFVFRDGSSSRLSQNGETVNEIVYLNDGFKTVTRAKSNNFVGIDVGGGSVTAIETVWQYFRRISQIGMRYIRNENSFFVPLTDEIVGIFSTYPSNKEWAMLKLGRIVDGVPDLYYSLRRTLAGRLRISSTDANPGLDVEGEITATAKIGYASGGKGAGGTVTQDTSKSTGVTLDRLTGAITMHNASLAADTTVSFTLTNSKIAANDVLIINHKSAGTVGAYVFGAQTGAGSAVINVRNVTGGSLGEAIVIQYVVFKGSVD